MKVNVLVVVVAVAAFGSAALVVKNMGGNRGPTKVELISVDWTPPKSSVDADYVAVAKALLGNGLADPRKGKFSKVQITIGDAAWGHMDRKDAFGWVSSDGKRVVVLDGLEYQVTGSFSPADLDIVFTAEQSGPRQFSHAIQISTTNPAFPALMLLVGRTDLAEKAFQTFQGRVGGMGQMLLDHLRQRYRMQTAQALMSRDDTEGVIWAKEVVKVAMVQEKFPLKDQRMQVRPLPSADPAAARDLYKDMQGRVEHPKHEPIDVPAILKLDTASRDKALIDALDTVTARQNGQPGDVDYMMDPVCKAVSEQGPEIVPLLIDAIATDKRYTRTISFGRDFFPERNIHTVKGVAWNMLTFVWPSAQSLQPDQLTIPPIEILRKTWNVEKGKTEEERWVTVLQNDQAGDQKWVQAAQSLVMPVGEVRHNFITYGSLNKSGAMKGEALRKSRGPEVSALLSKRALQICDVPANSGRGMFACDFALQVGHCLAKWDLSAGAKCLKEICAKSIVTMNDRFGGAAFTSRSGRSFAFAIADRAKAHDPMAAADYEKFCDAMDPSQGFMDDQCLRPLWEESDDLGLKVAGERLMAKWTKQLSSGDGRMAASIAQETTRLLPSSPMIAVSYFRDFLVSAIENSHPLGTIEMRKGPGPAYVTYKLPGGGQGSWNTAPEDDTSSLIGTTRALSVGDYCAQALAGGFIKGFPQFHILWPPAKREKARAEFVAWLKDTKRDWRALAKSSSFYRMYE